MSKRALRNAEAGLVNKMRSHNNSEFSEANSFVKKHENEMKSKFGGNPHMPQEAMNTDAYMCNDGKAAYRISDKLAKGLDQKAFPVRK
jgi:hypothetical protein